jgi:hypothetical protein
MQGGESKRHHDGLGHQVDVLLQRNKNLAV